VNQGRIARTLARGAVVSWREQPTQYDIEALKANIERVGLVIRVRWAIVVALALFSAVGAAIYGFSVDVATFRENMLVPALAMVFVAGYNTYYQLTYRRMGNLAFLNQAQLLFDMIVTAVLVYYSGGVYSWFSAMFLIFILEGAFILPKRTQVWTLVAVAALLYGTVVFGEYLEWWPHVTMPFVNNELHANLTFVLVRYLWFVTLYSGVAVVGILMMRSIREREAELRESSFVDDLTGLYNRQYFQRVLVTEVERARRNDRSVALVLADVYGLGEVNRTFGVDVGDALVAAFATALKEAVGADAQEAGFDASIACRVGGEELALIIPDVARGEDDATSLEDRAWAIAERFRAAVERTRASGVSAVVSVGIAVLPGDGETADALYDAADRMLSLAAEAGGNTVRASWLAEAEAEGDGAS
jgi:diguanylate cyclase (GGDEF)-like protein